MRVLIGCEMSGHVREAFRANGHDAWSCDLLPAMDGSKYHWHCSVFSVLGFRWDMAIFFPPCTYLSVSGMHRTVRGLRPANLTMDAIKFVERLWDCGIPRIAIENPVGVLSTRSKLGKPSQIIQPYQFGDDASKKTCLWLKGLPKLVPDMNKFVRPRLVCRCGHVWHNPAGEIYLKDCPQCGAEESLSKPRWANQTDSGQNRLAPSEQRASDRALTYPGIARAMADAWGNL